MDGQSFHKIIMKYGTSGICFLLLTGTVLVYSSILDNGFFLIDDSLQLTANVHVMSGLTWENIIWSFSSGSPCSPLTWFAYAGMYTIFGPNPSAFHALSLVLHALSGVLLFFLLKRMTGELWKSAFVGALFAFHPVNVESVAWVAELNNVLSGLFFMLTLLAYHFYTQKPSEWKRYFLALIAFGLGLLSKPVLMTLPFVLILLDFWPLKRIQAVKDTGKGTGKLKLAGTPVSRLILEKIPFLLLACASFASTSVSAGRRMGLYDSGLVPISLRTSNAIVSTVKYLGKLFLPHDFAVFYPYPSAIPWFLTAGAALILVLITIAAFRSLLRYPYFLTGWLWFLVGLAPFLGFFQGGLWPEMADRYAYLTFIGMFIAVAWGIPDVLGRWRHGKTALAAGGIGAVIVLMALTWIQAGYWRDSTTLCEHSITSTKNNSTVYSWLGVEYFERGEVGESIKQFQQAVAISPDDKIMRCYLGKALFKANQYDQALTQFQACLRIDPGYYEAYCYLGNIMLVQNRFVPAIQFYNHALKIWSTFDAAVMNDYVRLGTFTPPAEIYRRLGYSYNKIGDYYKAMECNQRAGM